MLFRSSFIGVSKKARDPQQRRALKRMIRELKSPECGYIVRTNGLNESEAEFAKQIKILEAKWEQCKQHASQVAAPGLVHQESDSSETTLRDYFSEDVDAVWIDDRDECRTVVNYLKVLSPDKVGKITRAQAEEIAETKMQDLTAADMDAAVRTIAGSARSMGITVEGL